MVGETHPKIFIDGSNRRRTRFSEDINLMRSRRVCVTGMSRGGDVIKLQKEFIIRDRF